MKFSVSNIAWSSEVNDEALALLLEIGISGIEVAPTKIAPWAELSTASLRDFRRSCEIEGIQITSLQAILFGRPEAKLLGDDSAFAEMVNHTAHVGTIADELGARVAVFGAPSNRKLEGLPRDAAWRLAVDRFRMLGDVAAKRNLTLGIEPLPPSYGGEFLTRAADVVAFVNELEHEFVKTHLDTACVALSGDSIGDAVRAASSALAHFHVSEPQLAPIDPKSAHHTEAAASLNEVSYGHWITLEMREDPKSWPENLVKSAKSMVQVYSA